MDLEVYSVPDYKKMYHIVCSAVSKALDLLPKTYENTVGRQLLQEALYEAEELYVSFDAPSDSECGGE